MKNHFSFLFTLLVLSSIDAQTKIKGNLFWNIQNVNNSKELLEIPWFEKAQHNNNYPEIPTFVQVIDLAGDAIVTGTYQIVSEKNLSRVEKLDSKTALNFNEYKLNIRVAKSQKKFKAIIEFTPIRFTSNNSIQILEQFNIDLAIQYKSIASLPAPVFTRLSELQNGQIFKISIQKKGIYKLDKKFFEDKLKVNLAGVNPMNIRLLGNGGKVLPESNSIQRTDDLKENRIYFSGEEDGVFNDQDYILFYADGPDNIQYDSLRKEFIYSINPYSEKSFYFIKFDTKPGLRISKKSIITQTEYSTNKSMDLYHHQKDLVNLLDKDDCNHGSGQNWYGEELSNSRELDLSNEIYLNFIDPSVNAVVSAEFASRCAQSSSLKIQIEGNSKSVNLGASPFSCTSRYATNNSFRDLFTITSNTPNTLISFPQTGVNSDGWLDYFQISYWKNLNFEGNPLYIFNPEANRYNSTRYNIQLASNNLDLVCWKISLPTEIIEMPIQKGILSASFGDDEKNYNSYVLFNPNGSFLTPEFVANIENQNIHEIDNMNLVIVYHSSLKREAERLLKHRTAFSGLKGILVDIDQLSNEFGSGSKDPTAIRDFARMLYTRSNEFRYLILFGSGSFDFRHLTINTKDYNLVPSYQTKESLDPILAYPSDDYFGLLDDGEGENLEGMLDVEIGRILARSIDDATSIVDKIIKYDTDSKILSDWKNNLLFVADDEDGNTHMSDIDKIAVFNKVNYPNINQQKIYLDAYEQISTPGGERYPDVNSAITEEVFKGAFVMTYLGHGGPTGLAQERVLQDNDIKTWDNEFKLPLMITATCSFTPFDDPRILSAGQLTQIQKKGTIALLSTVRAVYANENFALTFETFDRMFKKVNNEYPTLGDIILSSKNNVIGSNSHKYYLFGDPSMKLAYPKYDIAITTLNDKPMDGTDTLKALQKVNLKGFIKDKNSNKNTQFNGLLYVTIFDKSVNLKTRANNGGNPFNFNIQKNILFKGTSQIVNGEWSVDFIVPKDINYSVATGKISLYASNLKDEDAAGYSENFFIGGFVKDTIKDIIPPTVKLFINNEHFVNGGITNENPKIYAELSDDNGINITGNSIGHDLIAILDGEVQNPILLNSFFNTKVNDFREGTISYPLKNLSIGKHQLSLTAWDISNNRGIGNIEFNVISSDDVNIEKVYNYPNPFNNKTKFQFETNYINIPLEITIQIQSTSGRIVRTIQEKITPNGFRIDNIEWDGKDDFGNQLANGVYLYRVGLYSSTKELILSQKSGYQKLVLLR